MNRTNDIDYIMIDNYEEYLNFKTNYNDMIEVKEKEFEKSFVFVAITPGNVSISNEYVNEETLYIDITRDYENEEFRREFEESPTKVISTKISNNLKRDNIILTILPLESNEVIPIKQLIERDDYTPEEAIKNGYIVTEYYYEDLKTYMLSDESLLNDFIKKVENNEDTSIRSIDFGVEITRFTDVRYHDGVITTYTYYKNKIDPSKSNANFAVGDYISCYSNSDGTEISCCVRDSTNGFSCLLCCYSLNNTLVQNNEKNKQDLNEISFLAEIENIYSDNKLLIEGIEENDINFRGEFFAYITATTEILKNGNKADITDIETGQKVKVTFTNGVQESSPGTLEKVIKIEIIN